MDIDAESLVPQSYTILRIKRKRHEGPLDALAVESRVRRKKSRGGIGVFRFAQTVEHDAWQDEQRRRDLQDQISRLASETSAKTETQVMDAAAPLTSLPTIPCQQKDESNRRYTIIEQDIPESETRRLPTSPPKVIVSQDMPPKNTYPDFKMYDAVLSAEKPKIPEVDSEMDKFIPMLKDYLKLHDDIFPDSSPSNVPVHTTAQLNSTPPPTPKANDYVWDVFYHRPATLSEWNEAANVGTLTGLPPAIVDPYDSASDSEEEDEWDEDSNAEEYYKNDYPDEEEPSSDDSDGSDVFHEHSDHSDPVYQDDEDDYDWR